MKSTDSPCDICGSPCASGRTEQYIKCTRCGHESLIGDTGGFIVNEALNPNVVGKTSALDRFKRAVLLACRANDSFLLDVGSGSGKFLHLNKTLFRGHLGLEVSPACVEFSRSELGLRVAEDISDLDEEVSVATFWHSMEHIPIKQLKTILFRISAKASDDFRLIVSVPNAASLQYRMFGKKYPYFDPSSHIHQFTAKSLDLTLSGCGFDRVRAFFSLSYCLFGYLQGFMNLFNPINNYVYYRRKRGWTFGLGRACLLVLDLYNLLLAAVFILPSLTLCLYDYLNIKKGGVLTFCYRKRRR